MKKSICLHFFVNDQIDCSSTLKSKHRFDDTMAAHPIMVQIVYTMRYLEDCLEIEEYKCFEKSLGEVLVLEHIPKLWVRMYNYLHSAVFMLPNGVKFKYTFKLV